MQIGVGCRMQKFLLRVGFGGIPSANSLPMANHECELCTTVGKRSFASPLWPLENGTFVLLAFFLCFIAVLSSLRPVYIMRPNCGLVGFGLVLWHFGRIGSWNPNSPFFTPENGP